MPFPAEYVLLLALCDGAEVGFHAFGGAEEWRARGDVDSLVRAADTGFNARDWWVQEWALGYPRA